MGNNLGEKTSLFQSLEPYFVTNTQEQDQESRISSAEKNSCDLFSLLNFLTYKIKSLNMCNMHIFRKCYLKT